MQCARTRTHTHTHSNILFPLLPLQGSAKLEKAEILQMTVDHLRHLHQSRDARGKAAIDVCISRAVLTRVQSRVKAVNGLVCKL